MAIVEEGGGAPTINCIQRWRERLIESKNERRKGIADYSPEIGRYLKWRWCVGDEKGTIPTVLAEPGDRGGEAQAPRA